MISQCLFCSWILQNGFKARAHHIRSNASVKYILSEKTKSARSELSIPFYTVSYFFFFELSTETEFFFMLIYFDFIFILHFMWQNAFDGYSPPSKPKQNRLGLRFCLFYSCVFLAGLAHNFTNKWFVTKKTTKE